MKNAEIRSRRPTKACKGCGAMLSAQRPSRMARRSYCGTACYYAHVRATNARRQKPCVVCGGTLPDRVVWSRNKTCSAKCGYELRKRTLRPQRACVHCHTMYWPQTKQLLKYCSRRCYLAEVGLRPAFVTVACTLCGAKTRRTLAAVKRVVHTFCSQACSRTFYSGANSPVYRGDKDPNRGAAWNRLAESIRLRDCYHCRRCGNSQTDDEKLSVDHIRPWRSFTDKALANDPDNLASLCRECHSYKTHTVEQAWLRGDVLAWKQWVASLSLPSAARFGFMA